MTANAAKVRAREVELNEPQRGEQDFDDADIDDTDLITAATGGFDDIDDLPATPPQTQVNVGKKRKISEERPTRTEHAVVPKQWPDGRWECQHSCKDKTACKHLCCRDGLEDKPRLSKKKKQQLEMRQNEAPTKSPIDDYFKQTKKQDPTKSRNAQKQREQFLKEEEHEERRFDTASTLSGDPFDIDQNVRGIAARDSKDVRKSILAHFEPSSQSIFMTSSPDKRPIEAVDLSGSSSHISGPTNADSSFAKRGGTMNEDFDDDFHFETYERPALEGSQDMRTAAPCGFNEDSFKSDGVAASASRFQHRDYDDHQPTHVYNEGQALPAGQYKAVQRKPYVSLAELEHLHSRPSVSLATKPRCTPSQRSFVRTGIPEAYLMSDGDDDFALRTPLEHPEGMTNVGKSTLKVEETKTQSSQNAEVKGPDPLVKDELVDWFKNEFGDFAECV